MNTEHLLVDEIRIDSANLIGTAKSTLYDFPYSSWVSPHNERDGYRIGPMTLLDNNPDDRMNISVRSFGERKLHTDGKPARLLISYRERWRLPETGRTVYILVLPKEYVATHIELRRYENHGYASEPPLLIGVTDDGQLFYHTIVDEAFDIETRLELNTGRYRELIKNAETVEGTKAFEGMLQVFRNQPLDFWFKLLELGTKLIGRP